MDTVRRCGSCVSRVCLLLAALAVVGCAGLRKINDPPKELLSLNWAEVGRSSQTVETSKVNIDGLAALFQTPAPAESNSKPLHILSVSAGGKYAAYSAGILEGWTAHGSRPTFDVVTGVSSGAIVSLYAFLGPQYDAKLKHFFTMVDQKDIFPIRPFRNLAFHGALAYPHGFKRINEQEINSNTLCEIRDAHLAGRRLYLSTMNVETKRLVTWDIGGIACSGRPDALELIRQIMVAATAVPGLLPPVEFDVTVDGKRYTEQHCDAGPVTQTFVRFGPNANPVPGTKWLAGSHLYCLSAGKLEPDPIEGRRPIVKRISLSISAALYALYKAELLNLYALCQTSGMQFHLAAIPQEFELAGVSTNIVAEQMKPLHAAGFQMAVNGPKWRTVPPGGLPGEEPQPRTGLEFTTSPAGAN